MGELYEWSNDASTGYQATTPAPDGAPEGMPAEQVNDHARETMAAVRRQHENGGWVSMGETATFVNGTTFTVPDTFASQYTVGRRVRSVQITSAHGTIVSASGSPTLTVTLTMDGSELLANDMTRVELGPDPLTDAPDPFNALFYASTYGGNGAGSQAITGVPFEPKYLMIIERKTSGGEGANTSWTTNIIVNDNAGGLSFSINGNSQVGNIISLDANGFTVGTARNVNGQTYSYHCIG